MAPESQKDPYWFFEGVKRGTEMAWSSSNRRERLPGDWPRRSRRVLVRDGWTCQLNYPGCLRAATEVDHKVPGDDHQEANLQAACSKCHAAKSSREGNAAKARKKAAGKRPPMRHPSDSSIEPRAPRRRLM